ncbi:MAG: aminoacyl-histidine dipeptidase [Deltaproteobacteria bacterium]|nr:aminoacyl-histidine dipeptidase [Deltaproteobacteria bacterium]
MDENLIDAQPPSLWSHFDEIRKIPRCSGAESAVAAHVEQIAARHQATWQADAAGNVVIRVPASPGAEQAPCVILQAHLDMVGEKNADVAHDFAADPIGLRREGEMLFAQGTTLGADNGVGIAAALAVVTDPGVVHGPLELLFTVDEETGLTGARNLDATLLRGRALLNLDSEEHGALFIGCAGGAETAARLQVDQRPLPGTRGLTPLKIEVRGLAGGHSGIDIHLDRGNALVILRDALARVLALGIELQLASFTGGSKHNAIPREAEALVWTSAPMRLDEVLRRETEAVAARYQGREQGIRIQAQVVDVPVQVWSPLVRDRFLSLLAALPHGVIRMSQEVPGLVETSNNVAVAAFDRGMLTLTCSSRSSVNGELRRVQQGIVDLLAAAGFEVDADEGYPGWAPNLESPILRQVEQVFLAQFGKPAQRKAIHAGLECGLLGAKVPGLDMISFGPDIFSPHSPTEHVSVPSVASFWQLLCGVLAEIARAR